MLQYYSLTLSLCLLLFVCASQSASLYLFPLLFFCLSFASLQSCPIHASFLHTVYSSKAQSSLRWLLAFSSPVMPLYGGLLTSPPHVELWCLCWIHRFESSMHCVPTIYCSLTFTLKCINYILLC